MNIRSTSQLTRPVNNAIRQMDPTCGELSENLNPEAAADSDSRKAMLITEALRTVQTTPDIRADKVAEIRSRIEAGTYQIDAKAIAMALLGEEAELLSL